MAFHPFNSFRRHKKGILVAITVMIMFIFVLSWGGRGDFFDQMASYFGAGRRDRAEPVTTLYGKKVTELDLDELRFQRNLANDFMRYSLFEGQRRLIGTMLTPGEAQKALERFPAPSRSRLEEILKTTQGIMPPDLSAIPEQFREQYLRQYQQNRMFFSFRAGQFLETLKDLLEQHPGEADILQKIAIVVAQMAAPSELYFGGSTQLDDLLDFKVWKHQADKLDIRLTDADVAAEVNRQTLSNDTLAGDRGKDAQRIGQLLRAANYGTRASGDITVEQVYNALRDELRVSMAQQSVLGGQMGAMGMLEGVFGTNTVPAAVTPDQYWNYYREQRSTLNKVWLLPVPVQGFLDEVKDTPTDKELRALFKDYKDQEPNPERETPGFRQPRRIRVEWVSGRPDSEHYQKLGRERVDTMLALSAAAPWLGTGSPAAAMGKLWLGVHHAGQLADKYSLEKFKYRQTAWTAPHFALPYYTSLNGAENVAATVAAFAGATATGNPLAVAVGYPSAAVARDGKKHDSAIALEARQRSALGGLFVGAGVQRSALTAVATLGALHDLEERTERYLPLSFLAGEMRRGMERDLARRVLDENVDKLRKQIEGWRLKPKEEIAAELEKAIKEYGLAHGVMKEPLDQHDTENDPAFKPLKEWLQGPNSKEKVAPSLFGPDTNLYAPPQAFPRGEDRFLYWKVQEVPAKTYATYDAAPKEIQEAVKQAWKVQKAREKARRAIADVRQEAEKLKNHQDILRYLRDRGEKEKWGQVFDLTNVVRMAEQKAAGPGALTAGKQYAPYKVPDDKADKINAGPELAERLLRGLKEPGDTTVVWDRPEKTYYVALLERGESLAQLERQFFDEYKKPADKDQLLQQLMQQQQRQYIRGVLEQLRAEAGKVNDRGQWEINPEVRKRQEGRGRGELGGEG